MALPRRPQQERSAATRAKILEAAYESLLDRGYGATTVGEVQNRAGVARGTLLHHFPTRGSLMAGVVEDIIERRLRVLTSEGDVDWGTGGGRNVASWDDVVDLVWGELQRPPFTAALELWVASRTDPDLRQALIPLQERIFGTVHRNVTRLAGEGNPRTPMLVQFTIDLLTGAHLAGTLQPMVGSQAVVEAWKVAVRELARHGADVEGTAPVA